MSLDPTQPYTLTLTLRTDMSRAVRPSAIVKILVGGVVCAMHAHDGTQLDVVAPRPAKQLGIAEREVRAWLLQDERRAVLGTRRVLWLRAAGFQWNPADDTLVSCTLRHLAVESEEGWRLDAEAAPALRAPEG